jgi:hypothetical protein
MFESKALRHIAVAGVGVLALTAIGLSEASGALAAPHKQVLSGRGADGSPLSPDSHRNTVVVNARLRNGLARGTLETNGRPAGGPAGTFYSFSGRVTCMTVKRGGRRVVVGALGSFFMSPGGGEPHKQPGKYVQVLTVEFGFFANPVEPANPVTYTFGVLGARDEGLPSNVAPNCGRAAFTHQILPTGGGLIQLMS